MPGVRAPVCALYHLTHGPEGPAALVEALRTATSGEGREPGCRSSAIWHELDGSNRVLLMEEWDTPESLERHMRTIVFRRLLAVLELSTSPPGVTYIEGGRRRGIEWVEEVACRR